MKYVLQCKFGPVKSKKRSILYRVGMHHCEKDLSSPELHAGCHFISPLVRLTSGLDCPVENLVALWWKEFKIAYSD